MSRTFVGADGITRCFWCESHADYIRYHDDEWGYPVADDTRLFEKICLEGFQSGLSWLTILRKREGFRAAFAGFEPEAVARFGERDVTRAEYKDALTYGKRALALRPKRGSIAVSVGDACVKVLDYACARQHYKTALELGDSRATARLQMLDKRVGK